jgi:hypothetical protein
VRVQTLVKKRFKLRVKFPRVGSTTLQLGEIWILIVEAGRILRGLDQGNELAENPNAGVVTWYRRVAA